MIFLVVKFLARFQPQKVYPVTNPRFFLKRKKIHHIFGKFVWRKIHHISKIISSFEAVCFASVLEFGPFFLQICHELMLNLFLG
jgi:hypothetical protein